MEPLQKGFSAEIYSYIQWRSPDWPKGAAIGMEFERKNFRELIGGFIAPNEQAFSQTTDQRFREEYDIIDDETRQKIAAAVPPESAFQERTSDWWPVWQYLPWALRDWTSSETLLIVAGVENFEGRPLVEWIADEFLKIREAVRDVLG